MRDGARRPAGAWALVLLALAPASAQARSQVELRWPARDVFPIAVRFVRVDRHCKVTDRDEQAGYVMFECEPETTGGAVRRGALELIALEGPAGATVRVQITLSDEPRYVELRFLELLERKLREERGPPVPARTPPRPPASPPGPDGGA